MQMKFCFDYDSLIGGGMGGGYWGIGEDIVGHRKGYCKRVFIATGEDPFYLIESVLTTDCNYLKVFFSAHTK